MIIRLMTIVFLCIIQSFVLYAQEIVFSYTGSVQTYTVPAGIGSIQVEAWGAEGGTGVFGEITPTPGKGGYAIGNLDVTPGEVLEIYVGGEGVSFGAGGFNGGGQSGTDYGASGGGAAFGSSPSDGGDGGGLNGVAGSDMDEFTGGGGGSQVAGGISGCCYGLATAGTFGEGGGPGDYHNAGGGGGWYGGGSGAGQAAAGGGSSYIEGLVDAETTAGVREGNGEVKITILCNSLSLTVTDYDPCINEYITLSAESETGGITTWEDGVEDGVPFIPGAPGAYFYTVNSTSEEDCSHTIEINVRPFPTVIANASPTELCEGESLILYGGGAETYEWEPGGLDDRAVIYPESGTHTYIATGTDEFGCVGSDEVDVVVHPAPELEITADNTIICQGDAVTLTASGGVEYDWDHPVENGVPFTIDDIGDFTYEVEIEDENGCEVEGEITITVGEPIEVTYTTVGEVFGDDGEIDITVTGGTAPYTFDWDNDGTGDFDDPEDLIGISGGEYVVVVNDAGTCSATAAMTIDSQLGIETTDAFGMKIYPNPANNEITLTVNGEFDFELSDISGKTIMKGELSNNKNIEIGHLAKGAYYITIKQNSVSKTLKFLKI